MWPDTSCTRWPTYYYISSRTSAASPSRDAAGVVRMEKSGGPGNADRADGRIVRQTFLWVWMFHQLHQGDVILTVAVVEPLFGREGDWDFIDNALFRCYFIGWLHGNRFKLLPCSVHTEGERGLPEQEQYLLRPELGSLSREKTSLSSQQGSACRRETMRIRLSQIKQLIIEIEK